MTYRELYDDAGWKLEHGKINGGEFDEMTKPLDEEIRQWIPCSERLPKHSEIVLVSFKTGMVQMCKYLDDGSSYSWWSYKDDCLAWNNTVDAWMPLPEPYKEEGDRND